MIKLIIIDWTSRFNIKEKFGLGFIWEYSRLQGNEVSEHKILNKNRTTDNVKPHRNLRPKGKISNSNSVLFKFLNCVHHGIFALILILKYLITEKFFWCHLKFCTQNQCLTCLILSQPLVCSLYYIMDKRMTQARQAGSKSLL